MKDQDLISHLLKNLANPAGTSGGNVTGLLQESKHLVSGETIKEVPNMIRNNSVSAGPSTSASKKDHYSYSTKDIVRPSDQCGAVQGVTPQALPRVDSTALFPSRCNLFEKVNETHAGVGRIMCGNIDLNNAYDGSQDCVWNLEQSNAPLDAANGSITCPIWMQPDFHKKSPSHTSRNSGSTSSLSPSSSSGEAQVYIFLLTAQFFLLYSL